MADRPILFSAPMVRALLDGRKTQTRRILKPQPEGHVWRYGWSKDGGATFSAGDELLSGRIPSWAGDRLWVRETWSGEYAFHDVRPSERLSFAVEGIPFIRDDVWYWADGNPDFGDWERPRPGIHMPRWASRLTLAVTDVRVERLNECSVEDACAEGALVPPYTEQFAQVHALSMYRAIWDGINGPGSWDANPWVVAYTFTVERKNIDQIARAA